MNGIMTVENELGIIEISSEAVSSIVGQVVLEAYGVVGTASKNFQHGLVELLAPHASHKGVDVHISDGEITVDVYVVMEYGVRISEVANNLMSATKFRVEKSLGMPMKAINVHVQALRFSD
jgi:uncharacterized alkaline shock family protein YloU